MRKSLWGHGPSSFVPERVEFGSLGFVLEAKSCSKRRCWQSRAAPGSWVLLSMWDTVPYHLWVGKEALAVSGLSQKLSLSSSLQREEQLVGRLPTFFEQVWNCLGFKVDDM